MFATNKWLRDIIISKSFVSIQIQDLRQAYCREEEQVEKVRQDEVDLKNVIKTLKDSIKVRTV